MQSNLHIREIPVEYILDLRWRLLRASLPRDTANFEGDSEPATKHLAAIQDGKIVGCCTILHRPWQDKPAWQLRGMAVEMNLQNGGIGRKLLDEVERIVRTEPHSLLLWCNARTPARGFYEKMGWSVVGEEFVIPTAGPHYRMTKSLNDQIPMTNK